MASATLVMVGISVVLALMLAHRRGAAGLKIAWSETIAVGRPLIVRLPLALLAAGLAAESVSPETIARVLGGESGIVGVFVAMALGAVTPGGPMVSFPLALVLVKLGVSGPQLTAYISAWSVFALHRMLVYELPMLGGRFCRLRIAVSLPVPPMAALAAGLVWQALGAR